MRRFEIQSGDADRRADKFLLQVCPKLPKSAVYKAFRNKKIKRNGKKCTFDEILKVGDTIEIWLKDDDFGTLDFSSVSEALPFLAPAYETPSFLIYDKPTGVAVQSSSNDKLKDLTTIAGNWFCSVYGKPENGFLPAPCHRLDANTSGLVVFAKTPAAARVFFRMQQEGKIQKKYLALCVGIPKKAEDRLHWHWGKDEKTNKVFVRPTPFGGSKPIDTSYRLLEKNDEFSLLEVTLGTGRSHQIRAQLAAIGTPILGDRKYGNTTANKKYHVFYQCLTAHRLVFDVKPDDLSVANELAGQIFIAKLPKEFTKYFPNTDQQPKE
ncbi:MAG: RluA family pseudouridine synthase [Oscillospiraceae bacterium]|nr:RluA family pseudouridine synthase [Oscillospiraceae bacterium]